MNLQCFKCASQVNSCLVFGHVVIVIKYHSVLAHATLLKIVLPIGSYSMERTLMESALVERMED